VTALLAADLDRTLIYSKKARALGTDDQTTRCVEVHDGKQVSFVTSRAAGLIAELAGAHTLVPVTTRVPEQYGRVRLPGPPPDFAIVSNGGRLLIDGSSDRDWTRRVARELAGTFPLEQVWDQLGHVCHPEFTVKLRNADGLFCYAVVHRNRLPAGFVEDVSSWAAERGWRVSLQGSKLYFVPERLTKSAAVAEVARRAELDLVLAAGDSLLDVDLLLHADRGIHPRHGELHDRGWSAPCVETTAASGIVAGEQIAEWFAERVA
jgi:hypothetical protein